MIALKRMIKNIRNFLCLINSLFEIVGANNQIMGESLNINNSDLEDNLQYILSKKHNCELIISNDKSFYSEDIQVFSSKNFCKKLIK